VGAGPPNVNLGPPNISETTRARKLTLKPPLDILKYPLWVQKIFPLGSTGPPNVNFRPPFKKGTPDIWKLLELES